MSMLELHASALEGKAAALHEFLQGYSKTTKVVYGFVEGKEDHSFYRGFIESLLPEDWILELRSAGSRDSVMMIYDKLDWRSFPRDRICFFVDRDLSSLVPEKLVEAPNIYITSGYSIENDIVSRQSFRRTLTELCGFAETSEPTVKALCDKFEQELERFTKELVPVMAWILHWRRNKVPANLNNIDMRELFLVEEGAVQRKPLPAGHTKLRSLLHAQCKLVDDSSVNVENIEQELEKGSKYRRFTRGKYLLWFFVQACNSMHKDACKLIPSMKKPPKKHVELSIGNAVALVGPRVRLPHSLREFCKSTYVAYVDTKATSAQRS